MGQYQLKSVWLVVHSTLMALTPVIILSINYFGFKEKVVWQAILRIVQAMAGVPILFLA